MTAKHVHKLKRLKYKSGNTIFFCVLPDCTFKTSTPLALGKKSICWRCGKDFIMSDYTLRLAKPHCEACHKTKNIETKIDEIVPRNPDGSIPYGPERYAEQSLVDRLNQALHQQAAKQGDEEI